MGKLARDASNQPIQLFYLSEDKVNVTSGYILAPTWVECVEAGELTLTWDSGEQDAVTMVEGMRYGLKGVSRVDIESGKFHF